MSVERCDVEDLAVLAILSTLESKILLVYLDDRSPPIFCISKDVPDS
jgi:hypothetical protein